MSIKWICCQNGRVGKLAVDKTYVTRFLRPLHKKIFHNEFKQKYKFIKQFANKFTFG